MFSNVPNIIGLHVQILWILSIDLEAFGMNLETS